MRLSDEGGRRLIETKPGIGGTSSGGQTTGVVDTKVEVRIVAAAVTAATNATAAAADTSNRLSMNIEDMCTGINPKVEVVIIGGWKRRVERNSR